MIKLWDGITADNGPPEDGYATATLTVVGGADLVDGETLVLRNESLAVTFEFDSDASVTNTDILRGVTFAGGDADTDVATALAAAINAVSTLEITAEASGADVILTRTYPGLRGNATVTDTVANAGFLVASMTGGSEAGFSLTRQTPGTTYTWDGRNNGRIDLHQVLAGTGLAVTPRLWLRNAKTFIWAPAGSNADETLRGVLNKGNAVQAESGQKVTHSELVQGLSGHDRIYLEADSVTLDSGNGSFDAWLMPAGV